MKRTPVIVIAPDSFKGSLNAYDAADAMKSGVLRAVPHAEVRLCPMADGGEGTLDALLSVGGSKMIRSIRGASGVSRPTMLGILPNGQGVVEVAKIVGITDALAMSSPVQDRTTAGVGEAILELLDHGCSQVYVALGGSSTNDGGFGMLASLGVRFLDKNGVAVLPAPSMLAHVNRVDATGLDPRLKHTSLIAMSDVDSPLAGPEGATFIFGPQKGVRPEEAAGLDASVLRVATLLETNMGRNVAAANGAGAAGGLGFAIQVLGGRSLSGAATVAGLLDLDRTLENACLVLTGEGKSDEQTLQGKAPFWIARQAAQKNIPAILISGAVDRTALEQLNHHFAACFSIAPGPIRLEDAIEGAVTLLANQSEQVARVFFVRH